MKLERILKRIAAVLILAAFFLPLSRCTQATDHLDESGNVASTTYENTDFSAVSGMEPDLESAAVALLFVWPILYQFVLATWARRFEHNYLVMLSELVLLTLSLVVVFRIFAVGTIRYGAIVFVVSVGTYGGATLIALARRLYLTIQSRGTSHPADGSSPYLRR